ncbi:MAG: hypothetical protein GC182_08850 [Rhodopseudomonas sp.]|nr:hypothetical protein [Rhodopseudomonas sp.]
MDQIIRQKVEELDGSRNPGAKSRAAVRRADLAGLLAMPVATAVAASGAITDAQFNALLADVKAIRQALDQIAGKVKP